MYGDEEFSWMYRARINRDAGQPGQGVKSMPAFARHRVSHLCNRPPHNFLKNFAFPFLSVLTG
jgi:hypothetical protein